MYLMSTINKMCCLSVVVVGCDLSMARGFFETYTVQDHHFNAYQPSKEFVTDETYEPSINQDLWVLGA